MLFKITTTLAFLAAQLVITWYGHFMGQLPAKSSFLGWQYDSIYLQILFTQIRWIWIPILINVLYGIGFYWGQQSFQSFITIIALRIAAAPVAAILFQLFFLKQGISLLSFAGLALIALGSILVATQNQA